MKRTLLASLSPVLLPSALIAAVLAAGACSPDVPKLKPLPDTSREKVEDANTDIEVINPSVDILFVVDNSGSMGFHQSNLIQNIDRFIAAFTKRTNIDYHIGVLTSSMDTWRAGSACCGKLNGNPSFVDRNTANAVNLLGQSLRVGTDGSATEMFFDPVVAALSPPLVDHENQGFLRKDAHLALVFITDAEDQSSSHNVQDTFDFLVQLKGRREKILSYGVIVPSTVTGCPRDDGTPPARIENFLNLMPNAGKNEFSLCDPLFGDQISQIADDLVRYVGNVIYLNRPPVVETIRVSFGTQVIPADLKKGWAFDPEKNALVFGDEVDWSPQPTGTKIKVTFESAVYTVKPTPTPKP